MTFVSARRHARAFLILLPLVSGGTFAAAQSNGDPIGVVVDQAKLVKMPENAATLVIGNPLIADVALQPGGTMVVTGKGYGSTNLIAMDRAGVVLEERTIQVSGASDKLVTVYRGLDRETYSCTPICQRRVTLGDGPTYFQATLGQNGALNDRTTNAANPNAQRR